jgi:hypothetical protein
MKRTFQKLHPTHFAEMLQYCELFGFTDVAAQIGMSPTGLRRALRDNRGVYPGTIRAIVGFLDGKNKAAQVGGAAPAAAQTPPPSASVARPKAPEDPSVVDAFGLICKALEPFPVAKRVSIVSAVQALMGAR